MNKLVLLAVFVSLNARADNPFGDAFVKSYAAASANRISSDTARDESDTLNDLTDHLNECAQTLRNESALYVQAATENKALRQYIYNLAADLDAVRKNPKLEAQFRSIYPPQFYPALDLILSMHAKKLARNR